MKKIYSILIALLALVGVAQAQTVTFTAGTDKYDTDAAGAHSLTKDGVTIAVSNGTLGRTDNYRVYKNQTLTVSSTVGNIAKIEMSCASSHPATNFDDLEGFDKENGVWTGSSASVTFTASANQVRMTKIEVTLKNDDPNYVATPKITPATGTYYSAQTVTITCDTEGATIYYTTDDSSPVADKGGPSETSQQYSAPFVVEQTTTVKAVAIKDGPSSKMAESVITIEQAASETIAEVLAGGAAEGVQTSATVVAVCKSGFLLGDGTGYIFVYTGSVPEVEVGDIVLVAGNVSEYGGCLQFSQPEISKTGTATVTYPTAREIDGAGLDALVNNPVITYIKVAGTLNISGSYYNMAVTGATAQGSILATEATLATLESGTNITITGFFVYQTGSKKYANIIVTGIEAPEVEYTQYNTLAAMKAAAPADEASATYAQLNVDNLLVSYVNGQSIYLFDGEDGMLIYGTNSKNLKTGDKISGNIKGKLYKRNGNTQLASSAYEVEVVSSENEIVPQEVAAADLLANDGAAYENELVSINYLVPQTTAWESRNISFDAYTDDSFETTAGIVTVRDNWNVATALTFNQETPYKVTGFVAVYTKDEKTTVQLYPRTSADIDNGETPVEYEFVGDGTLENAYIVADIQHKDATDTKNALETNVWVKAFIVGYINGSTLNAETATFNANGDEVKNTNVLVADAADANTVAQVIPIGLASGNSARTDLNLADNPSKLGTQVWLKGDIYKYMGVPGLKNVKAYSLDGSLIVDAINGITLDASTAKTIYNVAGQRVQNLNKAGLYIVNGKKVVVK